MAVYHFTIHAYRSWGPGNNRGYVHHTLGLLPPDEQMARWYDGHAKFDPISFEHAMQQLLTREVHAICQRRGWRLHAVGNEQTHLHLVLSWIEFIEYAKVFAQLKGALSHSLGQQIGPPGRKWFSHGGSKRRVSDRQHFDYLLDTYLPGHSGIFWKEGLKLP